MFASETVRRTLPFPARRGFTLLELLAVIVLAGLLAGLGAVGFRRSLVAAGRQQNAATLLLHAEQCRTLADRFGQTVTLSLHADTFELYRSVADQSEEVFLQERVHPAQIYVGPTLQSSHAVRFFSNGCSETYAVTEVEGGKCHVVIGISGQRIEFPQLEAARRFLAAAPRPVGNDAD